MPSTAVDFRTVCGCFLAVYINFMVKRAKLKAAMKIAIVSLKTRVDGVMLGLLLVYLFWGSLLLQCGDVELKPGPTHKDSMRQTRLTNGGNAATTENRWTSEHPLESSRLYKGTNPLGSYDHASDHEQHHDQ